MLSSFCNKKGGTVVAVLLIGILLNIVIAVAYFSTRSSMKKSGSRRVDTTNLNIAEAGKEHLYAQIRSGEVTLAPNNRMNVFTDFSFGNGSYNVSCSTNASIDTIWVTSVGNLGEETSSLEVVAHILPGIIFPPPSVRGAVTARTNVNVYGNVVIDGRDHNLLGALNLLPGVFGVSTCGLLDVSGNPHIGGDGLVPMRDNNSNWDKDRVVEENALVTPIFSSPEAFLNIPVGSLDQYKTTSATSPYRGIYFLTLDKVGPVQLEDSYGILIVHNSTKTAELEITTGNFTGIIIADRVKIAGNTQVLGAVVTLSDGEVSISQFGVGTPEIRYSSEVLTNLNNYLDNMQQDVKELSWKERRD